MSVETFEFVGQGISKIYDNGKWVICIKNWQPKNSIENIAKLEIHHKTDQQYVLLTGKCFLITAEPTKSELDLQSTELKQGAVYSVKKETWFNTITEPGTKLLYIQDALTTSEPDNSEYHIITPREHETIKNICKS